MMVRVRISGLFFLYATELNLINLCKTIKVIIIKFHFGLILVNFSVITN